MRLKETLCLVTLSLPLVVAGCATGPKFISPKHLDGDDALLYVFRPNNPPQLRTPTIIVNGVKVAELTNKGYFELQLRPGLYAIDADWSRGSGLQDRNITLVAEKGRTYYLLIGSHGSYHYSPSLGLGTVNVTVRSKSDIQLVGSDGVLEMITQCGLVEVYPNLENLILPR